MFAVTNFLILGPSALGYLIVWMTKPEVLTLTHKIIISIVLTTSMIVCLWYLYQTYWSDPGILPSLYMNSGIVWTESAKADNVKEYYVEYLAKNDLIYNMDYKGISNGVTKFYSFNKFRYLRFHQQDESSNLIVDKKKKHNKLSYCETCEMLRPPRSFHCGQCGVCIEAHDHHCPYVGNCIGYRNLKYFLAFLFWTATHALVTLTIMAVLLGIN